MIPSRSAREDAEKIAVFNQTSAAFPDHATLPELIEAQAQRNPDCVAVICDQDRTFGTSVMSYAEVNRRANQLAYRLKEAGVEPGHIVALLVERSFAMIIGILGVLKAGAAYLPLSPQNPRERTEYMLRDANARALLMHDQTSCRAPRGIAAMDLGHSAIYLGRSDNPEKITSADDLAYVIYTSGSTGKPKGVMIEHRSVINRLHWMQRTYPIGEHDVILQKTPYYFDVSVWELFWWAIAGARLCFLAPGLESNPMALLRTIKANQVTVMHFVPSMLSVFLQYLDGRDARLSPELASVKRVFASGECLSPSHVAKFDHLWANKTGVRLTNLYGPTEATVDVTYYDCVSPCDSESIPIGRPIDNTRLYILQDGRQTAIGDPGELCIAGVSLARGYLNNPALTADKFIDNPVRPGERIYRTGDVARWLPDGNVEYLGRKDDQVKIRGLRIELGEIENAIRSFPEVSDCVTVVKRYSETVVLIVAYLVCKPQLDTKQLKQYLKDQLPAFMVPSHFERLEKMPLTASGKADRSALPEPSSLSGIRDPNDRSHMV